MAVFTFSTQDSKPTDEQTIKEIKTKCKEEGFDFSFLVLKLLKQWHKENINEDFSLPELKNAK